MKRNNAAVLTCALIGILCTGAFRAVGDENPPAGHQRAAGDATFLGFRTGREIRYVLESDGPSSGIRSTWGLRLEEFDRNGGIFGLTHETLRDVGAGGRGGQPIRLSTATAWINAYGFPTRVRFTTGRATPMGGLEYTVDYRYEDERFTKKLEGRSKEQEVDIDDNGVVNRASPSGMYLFMPVDAECIATARRLRDLDAGDQSIYYRGGNRSRGSNMEEPCRGREPIFANPGLLNLIMPALWEAGTGALDFLAMAPTGIDAFTVLVGNQAGSGGINVGGFSLFDDGPDPFDDGDDAFQMFGITTDSDMLQIDIGGRSVDVWRLKASAPLESAYVDGNGSIARLDLPADPETGERFWIRRLRPNEY